jgi:hypothetical protein
MHSVRLERGDVWHRRHCICVEPLLIWVSLCHRYRGFWWSPDSSRIAYAEADETVVPEYDIAHLGKEDPTHSETHRYPFAGEVIV